MALSDPIRKLVQFVLDKRSAEKTEQDAKKSLDRVDKAFDKLKKSALKLGGVIAAAFAVRKIVAFGKETLRVAADADAIWTRLGEAIESVGVNAGRAIPEVQRLARATQDMTTVGDEDFAAVLTELITTSGDYRRSLQNVGVVLDLAAAKQIEFRTAAQLVGRAMVGQTGTLTRYGIVVKEGEDAVEVLRRTFAGFAENEAASLQGQVLQLNNEWSDFKQAIGEALTAAADGESIIQRLTLAIKGLTEWVQKYINATKGLPETFLDERESIDRVLEASETAEDAIRRLSRLRGIEVQRLQNAEAELAKKPGFFSGLLSGFGGKGYAAWRAGVEDARDAVEGYRLTIADLDRTITGLRSGDVTVGPPGAAGGGGTPTPEPTGDGTDEELSKYEKTLELWKQYPRAMIHINESARQQEERTERLTQGWARLNSQMEMSPKNAAKLTKALEEVGDAAAMTQQEFQLMNAAADVGAVVVAGIFGSNIGQLAKWKAEQNAIMAAEQLAMAAASALIPGLGGAVAAKHVASAKLFAGLAAAWGALAGATGGFSGGGGAPSTPADTGGAGSVGVQGPGSEVNIYLVGEGFDAMNPRVQRVVYAAQREAEQRYGPNANVKVLRQGG